MAGKEDLRHNVWAKKVNGDEIYIGNAESGKKGYYCIGCGHEVIARKGQIKKHHFAHAATDVEIVRECTYSCETYRHQLGKEFLQELKKIKVPGYNRINPKTNHPEYVPPEYIHAHEVIIERQVYEDENGYIRYGQGINFESEPNKYLLVQPDVIFLDEKKHPILFIELIATHKITDEKLARLKSIGVNTVSVKVPKSSEEEIKSIFHSSNHTKWVYHHEQTSSTGISNANRNSEGVLSPDQKQRTIPEAVESFECRSAQIKNLIRRIGKLLESEQYKRAEQGLRKEIHRVEENTEEHQERWRGIEDRIRGEEEELSRILRESIGAKISEENQKYRDLERRYTAKAESLEERERNYRPDCQAEIDRIEERLRKSGRTGKTVAERIEAARSAQERAIRDTEAERERRAANEDTLRLEMAEIRVFEERAQKDIENFEADGVRIEKRYQESFDRDAEGIRRRIEQEERALREYFESEQTAIKFNLTTDRAQLTKRFEEDRAEAIRAIQEQSEGGSPWLRARIKECLQARELLSDISKARSNRKGLRELKKLFDTNAYKKWVR